LSKIYLTLAAALLAGCTNLPAGGPAHRDISRGATASIIAERDQIIYDYVLVDLTEEVLSTVPRDVSLGSFFDSFGADPGPSPTITVGANDILTITIFESAAGGLFIPPEAGVRAGNFITLPPQTVGKNGTIAVPYAGEVQVAGRTPQKIKADIERKLSSRAVEPQVIVTLGEQSALAVTVFGDFGSSRMPVRPNERILDVIARTGGPRVPGYELFVTLQRKDRGATVFFPTLISNPRENVFVAPGDTIYAYREQQKFTAVGALGSGGQTSGVTGAFAFEQERLSLNEAIAKAGGLLDQRANTSQVFIYRMEYRNTLEKLGLDVSRFPADKKFVPTVYRANFRDPSIYFAAQRFSIRHKDAIYVANADSVELEKFLFHTRAITGTISGTASDIVSTRESFRALGR
jgi:polysaccharide biosynthesis/export protein